MTACILITILLIVIHFTKSHGRDVMTNSHMSLYKIEKAFPILVNVVLYKPIDLPRLVPETTLFESWPPPETPPSNPILPRSRLNPMARSNALNPPFATLSRKEASSNQIAVRHHNLIYHP
jgi:hypothetical protein